MNFKAPEEEDIFYGNYEACHLKVQTGRWEFIAILFARREFHNLIANFQLTLMWIRSASRSA